MPAVYTRVLYLSHLLSFCRKTQTVVEFRYRGDVYAVGSACFLKQMSQRSVRIDPRLALPMHGEDPCLQRDSLSAVYPGQDDSAPFVMRSGGPELGGTGQLAGWDKGESSTWQTLMDRMAEAGIDPGEPVVGSLRNSLAAYEGVPEKLLRRAEEAIPGMAPGTTLGQALLAVKACTPQQLLTGAIGAPRIFAPVHRFSNSVGKMLLDKGEIDHYTLERALLHQIRDRRPLPDMLHDDAGSDPLQQAVAEFDALPIQGPERELLGEILVAMKALSRTDLLAGLMERQRTPARLGQILVDAGTITREALMEAVVRQRIKRRARRDGTIRLGHILLERNVLSEPDLHALLVRQIDDPRPLGELLLEDGSLTPEALIVLILELERRLDALVEERLPEAMDKARAAAERKGTTRKLKKESKPPVEEEPPPVPRRRRGFVAGGASGLIAVGLIGFAIFHVFRASTAPGNPMMNAEVGKGLISKMGGTVTYDVDIEDIMASVERGERNPLGKANVVDIDVDEMMKRIDQGEQVTKGQNTVNVDVDQLSADMERGIHDPMADQLKAKVAAAQSGQSTASLQESLEGLKALLPGNVQKGGTYMGMPIADQKKSDEYKASVARSGPKPLVPDLAAAGQATAGAEAGVPAPGPTRRARARGEQAAVADLSEAQIAEIRRQRFGRAGADTARNKTGQKAIDPDKVKADEALGEGMRLVASEPGAARRQLEIAQQLFTRQVDRTMEAGHDARLDAKLPRARALYEEALALNAKLGKVHVAMARAAFKDGKKNEAKKQLEQARSTFQSSGIAHGYLGDVLAAMKRTPEAIAQWQAATRLTPLYAPPLLQLGLVAKSRGQYGQARKYLKTVTVVDPDSRTAKEAAKQLASLPAK